MNGYIDKTKIRGISIEKLDLEVLRTSDAIYNITDDTQYYMVEDAKHKEQYILLDRLTIKDDDISFRLDYRKNKGVKNYYTELDLTIKTKKSKDVNNVVALTSDQQITKLKEIKEYLRFRYGVYIDFKDSRYYYIELNKTRQMEHDFNSYRHIFHAIVEQRNKNKYRKFASLTSGGYEDKEIIYLSSKVETLKLYNKSKQMWDCFKISIDKNMLRLEYVLNGYEKISDKLGTCKVTELTDDSIKQFIDNEIKEDVFNSVEKEITEENKVLKKVYSDLKKTRRCYIKDFCSYCNKKGVNLFSIEQIYDIAESDIKRNMKNYSRQKKLIGNTIIDDIKNNMTLYEEFKTKFSS